MPLSRLDHVASMVKPCMTAVDIGTDHGYLALNLLQSGKVKHIIATDLRPLPIQQAQRTFALANVHDGVTFVISDGLLSVDAQPETAILAGMGGDLAIKIMTQSLNRFQAMQQIIIQVNSHVEKVRHFVCAHGFDIDEERLAFDGFYYPIISIHYTGIVQTLDPKRAFLGAHLKPSDSTVQAYLIHERDRYHAIVTQHPRALQAKERLQWINEHLNG